MKRYLVNAFALLILVGIVFIAANGYAKPPLQVEGNTSSQRAKSVADNVSKEYSDAVVVTRSGIDSGDSGKFVRYSLRIIVPEDVFMGKPTTQEEATKQAELYKGFISSLSSLLELSTRYLLNEDPTLTSVSILIILPDDQVFQADSSAEQLRIIGRDPKAPEEAWMSTVSTKPLTLVDEELWKKAQEILNSLKQPVTAN